MLSNVVNLNQAILDKAHALIREENPGIHEDDIFPTMRLSAMLRIKKKISGIENPGSIADGTNPNYIYSEAEFRKKYERNTT